MELLIDVYFSVNENKNIRIRDISVLNKALVHNDNVVVVVVIVVFVIVVVVRQRNGSVVAVVVAFMDRIFIRRFLFDVVATTWLKSGEAVGQRSIGVKSEGHKWLGIDSRGFDTKKDLKIIIVVDLKC